MRDLVTIILHPGVNEKLYREWEKTVIGEGLNIEYAYFGDLNGDGNLDIVFVNADRSDVSIVWGPGRPFQMDHAFG